MSARYYCVQWCHRTKGWIDLPSLASTKEMEAKRNMESFQAQKRELIAMRTIRKPHGWKPDGKDELE